jgi:hypothetical protein
MYFELEGNGWSEVHYTNDTAIPSYAPQDNDWVDGISNAAVMFTVRRKCLVEAARLKHMRITDLAHPGQFIAHDYADIASAGLYTFAPPAGEAETFESLLLTLQSGNEFRRKVYLGGIPDIIVGGSQLYEPTSIWQRQLNIYLSHVGKAPYCVRSRPRPDPLNAVRISQLDVQADGKHAIVSPKVRPDTNPQEWYVLLRGVKNPSGWNGVHKATFQIGGTGMVIGPTRRALPSVPIFDFAPSANVVLMTPSFNVITAIDVNRIVERKRGRPFGKSRGRR